VHSAGEAHGLVQNGLRFLKMEAQRTGRDLTGYVNRMLDGVRTRFGLPAAAATDLDADREALGMERYEYLLTSSLQQTSQSVGNTGSETSPSSPVRSRFAALLRQFGIPLVSAPSRPAERGC
jgi:hypothetical protein